MAALLLSAGCLEPALVECGDLSCPENTTCLGDRCVTPDQLSACDGVAEGGVCSISGAIGKCTTGVCEPVGCGNGRLDDGELCDDGNAGFGDGCSGDCRSLETCGNGIVDAAAGESCDCGDAAHKPERCRSANSDSIDAECSTACELRYCGDGAIDTLEQCDGALLGGQSCGDFGYYHGTLGCSELCRFDVESCEGRCGDGTIEPAFGEYCDGAAPPGSCLSNGFDAGTLGCSAACTPDVASCELFGWRQLDTASLASVWAGDADTLVVATNGTARMVINGIAQPAPSATYKLAAGAGTTAYAIGTTSVATWATSQWSTIGVPWAANVTLGSAWASPSLGLYVVAGGALWRYSASAWTNENAAGTVLGVTGDAVRAVYWTSSTLLASTGGVWTAITVPAIAPATITGFATSGTVYWLGTSNAMVRRGAPGVAFQPPVATSPFTRMVTTDSGDLVLAPSMVRRFADGRADGGIGAPATATSISLSRDGGVLVGTATGAYRLRTGLWSGQQFITDNDYLSDAITYHVTTRGTRQIYSGYPWVCGPGYCDFLFDSPGSLADFAEAADTTMIFATVAFGGPGLWGYDQDAGDWVQVAGGDYERMTIAGSGQILAGGYEVVAAGGLPTWRDGWSTRAVTGYAVKAVEEAADTSALFAIGQPIGGGPSVVLHIAKDGTVSVLPGSASVTPWRGLWVAPDDTVYAVGGDSVYSVKYGDAQGKLEHIAGTELATVSGTSTTDVFVGGRALPFSTFTGITHWNGTSWTGVRLLDAKWPLKLYVTSSLITYVSGRNFYDLPRVVLW